MLAHFRCRLPLCRGVRIAAGYGVHCRPRFLGLPPVFPCRLESAGISRHHSLTRTDASPSRVVALNWRTIPGDSPDVGRPGQASPGADRFGRRYRTAPISPRSPQQRSCHHATSQPRQQCVHAVRTVSCDTRRGGCQRYQQVGRLRGALGRVRAGVRVQPEREHVSWSTDSRRV
jgi:hypothetical protein